MKIDDNKNVEYTICPVNWDIFHTIFIYCSDDNRCKSMIFQLLLILLDFLRLQPFFIIIDIILLCTITDSYNDLFLSSESSHWLLNPSKSKPKDVIIKKQNTVAAMSPRESRINESECESMWTVSELKARWTSGCCHGGANEIKVIVPKKLGCQCKKWISNRLLNFSMNTYYTFSSFFRCDGVGPAGWMHASRWWDDVGMTVRRTLEKEK